MGAPVRRRLIWADFRVFTVSTMGRVGAGEGGGGGRKRRRRDDVIRNANFVRAIIFAEQCVKHAIKMVNYRRFSAADRRPKNIRGFV